jgi:hypothetical protein
MVKKVMSQLKKNRVFFLLVFMCSVCISNTCISQKVNRINFSGTWSINNEKSEFGGKPAYVVFRQLIVDQKSDSIFFEGYNKGENNENIVAKARYSFNSESLPIITSENRKLLTTLSWSSDGKTLTKVGTYSFKDDFKNEEYKRTEEWSLSSDEKELSIFVKLKYNTGSGYAVKSIYKKVN